MLFQATKAVRSVCAITPEMLRDMGIRGLLLDIDNTLTTHDNPVPAPGVMEWVVSGCGWCLTTTRPVWNRLQIF